MIRLIPIGFQRLATTWIASASRPCRSSLMPKLLDAIRTSRCLSMILPKWESRLMQPGLLSASIPQASRGPCPLVAGAPPAALALRVAQVVARVVVVAVGGAPVPAAQVGVGNPAPDPC